MQVELPPQLRKRVTCYDCRERQPGCCHLLVTVHLAEALSLYAHAHEAIEARIDAIRERALEEWRVLGHDPLRGVSPSSCSHAEAERVLAAMEKYEPESEATWFRLARPCSLLTEDGRCSVYEHRPIACAAHFVVTPPPNCSPPVPKPVGRVDAKSVVLPHLAQCDEWCEANGAPQLMFYGVARAIMFARLMLRSGWTPQARR